MKLLFDENLSPKLPSRLSDLFPSSIHVRDVGMKATIDPIVWDYAIVFVSQLRNDRYFMARFQSDRFHLSAKKRSLFYGKVFRAIVFISQLRNDRYFMARFQSDR